MTMYAGESSRLADDEGTALVESPIELTLMADLVPHFVWLAAADGGVTYFNRQASDFTGVAAEDGYGWKWERLVNPDDFEGIVAAWEAARVADTEYLHEIRIRRFDGVYLWHAIRARPVPGPNGRTTSWLGTATDIEDKKQSEQVVAKNLTALVRTIAATVERRDPYTAGHQRRVADLAAAISRELALDAYAVEGIEMAASIHDLGKISVPAEILSKPGRLSTPECELMRGHAEAGYDIVCGVDFPWPIAEMIRQHHERMDGSGYPRGLNGPDILLGARIIAVADVVEAMTAHRPFRPGLGIDAALHQIDTDSPILLDAEVVEACIRLFHTGTFEFDHVATTYQRIPDASR